MPSPRSLLILSFSPIDSDARVLKQVTLFTRDFQVTTCGYGPAPEGVVNHVRIPDGLSASDLYGRFITLKWYRRAYWRISAVRWVRAHLDTGRWDAVLANDVEAVPLALELKPRLGVHADLHEYAPRQREDIPVWKRRIKPFYDWLCRRYVARATSWSTVSGGLAREYEKEFGFLPVVVTNAAPYAALEPQAVGDAVRIVHSGACHRNRHLMTLIDAMELADTSATLDLYLTPNDPPYLQELRDRAASVRGVRVNDPVPYDRLIATLNGYDLGVFVLPPNTFNHEWALPNKLFDYVQARLGVLVGPSAEMATYVHEYRLGYVTADFSAGSLAETIRLLTPADVEKAKRNAHAAADVLSSTAQEQIWKHLVDALWEGQLA